MRLRFHLVIGLGILLQCSFFLQFAQASTPLHYTPQTTVQAFKEIADLVREEYVEPVEEKKLLEGALNGMLMSLDPHSSYLDPDNYQELLKQTKGEFGGLGMEVTMENGLVKIVTPLDDTPAYKAGLQKKDLIIAIDQQPVFGLTLTDAVKKMRGEPKSSVKLLIKRENADAFEVKLVRELIRVKSVKSQVENDVGYIRISNFDEKIATLTKEAIGEFQKKLKNNLKGVVLDLRNNPGGLLEQAVALVDLFIDGGEVVSTRGRDSEKNTSLFATKGELLKDTPVVVLINGGSASAAEIVAGALQAHGRGLVVGEKSFGKGSVQTIRPLNNGGAIKLTISRYYTPDGKSVQNDGITPDIMIEQVADLEKLHEFNRIRESSFAGALKQKDQNGNNNPPQEASSISSPSPSEPESLIPSKLSKGKVEDYQKMRAIELARGMWIYQNNLKKNKLPKDKIEKKDVVSRLAPTPKKG
ncbi:MAG: S41 family peptidase [Alphaproteobacteria bacterium]